MIKAIVKTREELVKIAFWFGFKSQPLIMGGQIVIPKSEWNQLKPLLQGQFQKEANELAILLAEKTIDRYLDEIGNCRRCHSLPEDCEPNCPLSIARDLKQKLAQQNRASIKIESEE